MSATPDKILNVILSTEMNKIKEDAEFLRLGLVTGYIRGDEVINWADELIQNNDTPPYEIIEVSMAVGINDVISKLSKIEGEYDFHNVFKRYLGLLYKSLSSDKSKAKIIAHRLYSFMFECNHDLPSEIEQSIYYFDDGFDLSAQGMYGNFEDLTNELMSFLQEHSKL